MPISKIGVLFALTILGATSTLQIYADPQFTITLNQAQYQTGDTLVISGNISDASMPVVATSIYDPDGKILSANNLSIDSQNNFTHTVYLDSPFYEIPGSYTIKFDYLQKTHNEYFVISDDAPAIILEEEITPELVLLYTDKHVYYDDDTITITGLVSTLDSPTALVGIYDPFGIPAGFYFGQIDSNLEFTVNFLAKAGVNFKTDGTYSIKAHYAESEQTVDFDFYEEDLESASDLFDNPKANDNPKADDDPPKNSAAKPNPETTENSPKKIPKTPIIQNDQPEKKESPQNIPIIEKSKQTETKNKISQRNENELQDNLSVEDVALGIMLNQINLNCDPSKFTDSISYYDGMGPALYRLCKFDSALDYFDSTLMEDPNNVEIISNKGSTLGKLGYHNAAINHYNKALEIDPNYLPAKNNKANMLVYLGQYDEAIFLYQEVLAHSPDYATARKNLSIALSERPLVPEVSAMSNNELSSISYDTNFKTEMTPEIKEMSTNPKQESKSFFEEMGIIFSSIWGFLK